MARPTQDMIAQMAEQWLCYLHFQFIAEAWVQILPVFSGS